MKYQSITKVDRNALVVRYHEAHPELSYREIGGVFGISAPRVCVIIRRHKEREEERLGKRQIHNLSKSK